MFSEHRTTISGWKKFTNRRKKNTHFSVRSESEKKKKTEIDPRRFRVTYLVIVVVNNISYRRGREYIIIVNNTAD